MKNECRRKGFDTSTAFSINPKRAKRVERVDLEGRNSSRIKDNLLTFCNSTLCLKFKAFTRDISAGGLMLEMERKIPVDNKLDLEIFQPINRDKTIVLSITTLAKVIWVRKIERDKFEEGENKYKIGVQFLEINEDDRSRIAKYIADSLSE